LVSICPMFKNTKLVLITLFLTISNPSYSAEFLFSGFSFTGQWSQRGDLYPYAAKLSEEMTDKGSILDVALNNSLKNFKSSKIKLLLNQSDKVGNGPSVTLAFGLGRESVEEVKTSNDVISIYRVMTRILAFDWEEKKLIASFPVQVVYQNVTPVSPTSDEHIASFRKMYTDLDFGGNVFKAWANRLSEVEIKDRYGLYFGISNVSLTDAAKNQLPSNLSLSAYSTLVAQTLESTLSKEQQISIVPFTSGESIGKNMALRFSDATTLNLSLPEADYALDMTVKEFKNVEKIKGNVRKVFVAAYVNSRVYLASEDLNKTYFDANLKHINRMVFSTSDNVEIDSWSTYQTALRTLLSRFSSQISQRDKKILKIMSPESDLTNPFVNLEKVLEKCR